MADETPTPPAETPRQRYQEFWRRVAGTPSGVGEFSGRWAAAIAFARAAPADDAGSEDGWTSLGPRNAGGAVRSLAQDPTAANGATFYAGTAGAGLWRTTDEGNTWEPLGDGTIGIVPIGAVAIAPTDRKVIWVGTGEPLINSVSGVGLFRSLDAGVTFQRLAPPGMAGAGAANRYPRIRVDPTNPKRAWVASDNGLWRVTDTTIVEEAIVYTVPKQVSDLALAVDPANNRQLILIAGVLGQGVVQGIFNLDTQTTTWRNATLTMLGGAAAANVGRVKVAIAPSNANVAYALIEDDPNTGGTGMPQALYASANAAAHAPAVPAFTQPAGAAAYPADTTSAQAFYSLALEVHPNVPATVVAGHVNLYVSSNGGVAWTITNPGLVGGWITWQNNLTYPTRAEHGDMHAVVFDHRDAPSPTPRVWVGNDGGVSMTANWAAPFNWRKRSYGILGAQAVDVTSHPVFPSLLGCGMQDNATFFSYGGPTWYQASMADGAALAWNPTNARLAHVSWQNAIARLNVGVVGPVFTLQQPLADVTPPGGALSNQFIAGSTNQLAAGAGVFRTLVIGDPAVANRLVAADQNQAQLSTNGTAWAPLATGAFSPFPPPGGAVPEVGAIAFVPGSVNNRDVYVGTSTNDIFAPPIPAAPAAWIHTRPFLPQSPGQTPWVGSIAVHPVNTQVVAACAYQANKPVMLSHDAGATWFDASGTGSTLPDPVTSLAFHPTDEKVLFAGTIAGVFVARDLPAFVAAPGTATAANPTWKSFNRGLGPLLVNDLEVVRETLTLRAATFARGIFEANIRSTPAATYATPANYRIGRVRLSIREHALDDSRTYPPGHTLPGDPRLPAANPTPHLNGTASIDIKVNAPDFADRNRFLQAERFAHRPDGAELDEEFVCENPIAGDTNLAYVQVHNRGWEKAEDVKVLLYVADAGVGGVAPVLDGLNFPDDPTVASAWRLAAPAQTVAVLPGQPVVCRFEWTCPVEIQNNVALLAITTAAADAPVPAPAGVALAFAQGERRAALRIRPVVPDRVFIRDGVDDFGKRGSVAWGGRSPDIIVMTRAAGDAIPQATADNPATSPFRDLNDVRRADRVQAGNNTVFVRVHNRGSAAVNAEVRLFQVPITQPTGGAGWTRIDPVAPVTTVNGIPARGWRVARIQLSGVAADPVPALPAPWGKAFVLAAIVRSLNPVGGAELEPFPDVTTVTGVDEFWRLFGRGPLANNAAFRALRFGGP